MILEVKFKFRWFIPSWIVLAIFLKEVIGIESILYQIFLGMINGFLLDILGHKLKLWNYPRQPFFSRAYFLLVVPAWGIFGSQVNVIWNLTRKYFISWEWIYGVVFTTLLLSLFLFILYELPNLYRKSWKYSVSMRKVAIGWIPLILYFRLSYKIFYLIISAL